MIFTSRHQNFLVCKTEQGKRLTTLTDAQTGSSYMGGSHNGYNQRESEEGKYGLIDRYKRTTQKHIHLRLHHQSCTP